MGRLLILLSFLSMLGWMNPVASWALQPRYKMPVMRTPRPSPAFSAAAVSLETSSNSSSWGTFARMCRPANLPGSFLFVGTGAMAATHDLRCVICWPVLLASLITGLVTTSSCVVNDYFDYRVGTDLDDEKNLLNEGVVSLEEVKKFVARLYSVLLYLICLAPTAPMRLMLMGGAVSTFLYTKHLKPITWLKNLSVAFICTMAPVVGGMAAVLPFSVFSPASGSTLLGLAVALFLGVVHRELLMDVTDVASDAATGVATVPVVSGKRHAAKCSTAFAVAMAAVCAIASSSPLNAVGRINYRRWAGVLGSLRMAQRAFSVYQKCGSGRGDENESADSDDTAIDAAAQAAIDESQWTFVAILASFL